MRAAGALGVLFVGAALLHTGPGLRLMVRVGVACPALAVTPAAAAALRAEGVERLRGSGSAPVRWAGELTLGESGEPAARAAATGAGATCVRKQRGFVLLICTGGERETTYAFDERARLVSVDVMTRVADGRGVERLFGERAGALAEMLGNEGERAGAAAEVARNRAPFTTAIARWRFSDYLASLSAVRMTDGNVMMREQYQSLAPATPIPSAT